MTTLRAPVVAALLLLLSAVPSSRAFSCAGKQGRCGSSVPSLSLRPSSAATVPSSPGLFRAFVALRSSSSGGYDRQGDEVVAKKREPPYPKAGDVVRYFDVDGGAADGEALVGKIVLIQSILSKASADAYDDGTGRWLVEIQEMEDVGDGYYADYPSRKRRSKQSLRKLEEVAPVSASFVRTEDAYKIPRDRAGRPLSLFDQYKLVGYEGPAAVPVNEEVVQSDAERYAALKIKLLKDAALAGLFGTVLVELLRGFDDAITYLAGAIAGVGYVFFLSVKTDTLGSAGAKLGKNVSNLRFGLPAIVLVTVAVRNVALGANGPLGPDGPGSMFSTVTAEQFACAMLGFLTYRVTLFASQLSPVVGDSLGDMLPGSAGVALRMAQDAKEGGEEGASGGLFDENLKPVLLVCGPAGTGKTSLVKKLVADGGGRFVEPMMMDRVADGATFERLELRDEFLKVDATGRYGLTAEGVLTTAASPAADEPGEGGEEGEEQPQQQQVVVVDADVALAKKLTQVSGARLIGVWVGLDSTEKFENRLRSQIESGDLPIPEDETEESVIRGKVKAIVQDIEYGVVSGIFEFTILNNDFDTSFAQLEEAAEYCFK